MLVDAEVQVSSPSPWEHLRQRDGWFPPGMPDEHCHLMAQVVEAWLVSDPEALGDFYGQGFRAGVLPTHQDIEEVEKTSLYDALSRATEATRKGRYHKISHCSELLARIDPARVRARARHCDRLFRTLEARVSGRASGG